MWPTLRGESIVLDVGASIGADAHHLMDLAVMGAAMARIVFDIERPGKLHKATGHGAHGGRLLCALPGYQRLDSLAIDSAGNICVGTLVTGMITVISPRGEILRQVKFPDSYVTNICFGGADLRDAYITASGSGRLYRTRWPRPWLGPRRASVQRRRPSCRPARARAEPADRAVDR